MYSRALKIYSGIGGGVGKWEPLGWYPFSSAVYVSLICVPSGEICSAWPFAYLPPMPDSCAAIPFEVS